MITIFSIPYTIGISFIKKPTTKKNSVGAFDFDNIDAALNDLLAMFDDKNHDFLREFLLTQHFHFFATHVASSTDKMTLVDHKLSGKFDSYFLK